MPEYPRVTPYYNADGALVLSADAAICGQALLMDPGTGRWRSVLLWCLTSNPGRKCYDWGGEERVFLDAADPENY